MSLPMPVQIASVLTESRHPESRIGPIRKRTRKQRGPMKFRKTISELLATPSGIHDGPAPLPVFSEVGHSLRVATEIPRLRAHGWPTTFSRSKNRKIMQVLRI